MGLFEKKFDLNKDCLRMQFDLTERKYVFYLRHDRVPYELLNKKTKKILDEKNAFLRQNSSLLDKEIERAKAGIRFNKLKSLGYIGNTFEHLGPVYGTMSREMELYLNRLVAEDDVLIGIHRIGDMPLDKIDDVLNNGLIMTGHLGGASHSSINLGDNVSFYDNNKIIIKELMHADDYKGSPGSILIRIPDKDLTGDIYVTDKENLVRLNPKYILGYVPLEKNNHIERIIKREEQKDNNSSKSSYNYQLLESLYPQENIEEEHKMNM